MSCCIDGEYCTLEIIGYPVARLEHKCCECRASISPGEQYQKITQLFEGKFYRYKTCEKCADLRDSLNQVWCTYIETLKSDYQEYCDETGKFHWSDDGEEIIYPDNHLNLNAGNKHA